MFVQIMEGEVTDTAGIRRLTERWQAELEPGASGYLGSTAGVTDDGHLVMIARFATEADARANSERPEQGQWWSEMEKCFTGPVTFHDTTDVDTFRGGGDDSAGFVQVMKHDRADQELVRSTDRELEERGTGFRPDLLGGIRAWIGPTSFVELAYFTSEADARAAEAEEPPAELADLLATFGKIMEGGQFLDLRDPILTSSS